MPDIFDSLSPDVFDQISQTPATQKQPSWFDRQSPLKGASQEIGKLPGKFLETLGTVAEVAGPTIESAIGDPGIVPQPTRTPAQVIQDVQANPLVRLGQKSQREAVEQVPITPEEETGFFTKVGRGAGSMVPYVVAGPAAPALIGLESFTDHLTNDYEAEKSKGKSDDEAAKTAFEKGLVSGGLQATVFALLPKPLRKLGDKWLVSRYGYDTIKRFLAGRVANIGEGAVLGAASRISENAVEGEDLTKDVAESAAGMGALLGISPRGMTPEQQRDRFFSRRPNAPPGAEPPVAPVQDYVAPEPGPSALTQVIPPGGTMPQRTRIRLSVSDTTPRVPTDEMPKEKSPNGVYPAIRLVGGEVVVGNVGETHPDIIDRKKLNVKEIDQRGFVDQSGKFLDREQAAQVTQLPTNFEKARLHSTDLPETTAKEGVPSDQTKTEIPKDQVNAPSAVPPVIGKPPEQPPTIETKVGATQPKGPDQTPTELKIPTAEELSAMSSDKFSEFWNSLGENRLLAQQQTANSTSPVRLRQYATEAAGDVTRLQNDFTAKTKGGSKLTEAEMLGFQYATYKFQYFNEALREAGEPPVEVKPATIETQVGKRKKADRRTVMGSRQMELENRLAKELEKVENDWSVATQSGKVKLNADELKTGDVVTVRGEPLTVSSIDPDDGAVTLRGEKGGRWGERKLQPGQQIGVDEFKPGKEEGFQPEKLPAKEAAPKPTTEQKYRVEGQGPQLYTLIERLPQSETEKKLGEQPVRVRNDKTGKEETVLEAQIQAVKERTDEEKAATKRMTKRELDDLIRKFGMEPSEFPNMASKKEALKRARAKAGEREASLGPIDEKTLKIQGLRGVGELEDEFQRTHERQYDEPLADVLEDPKFERITKAVFAAFFGDSRFDKEPGIGLHQINRRITQLFKEFNPSERFKHSDPKAQEILNRWFDYIRKEHPELYHQYWLETLSKIEKSKEFEKAFALNKLKKLGLTDYGTLVLDDWGTYREDVWTQDPALAEWIEQRIFPGKDFGPLAEERQAAFAGKKGVVLLGSPIELSTPEQIRKAISNPNVHINDQHRKALDWMVRSGMMEKLPGLRLQIVDYIRGGAAGEYVGDQSIARFLRWTDADVPIHEFLHHVWRNLGEEDRAFISSVRQEMLAKFAPQMGDTFRLGMSSDQFMEKGFNRDLYHLSNDSEFFVWMMTEKGLKEMNKPQAVTFVQKIQAIIRQLWNGFKDALGMSKYQDALWRQILSSKYEYREQDGQNFSESENGRNLALVRSRRDAAEQTINYDEMSDTQKKEIGTDVELQNTFVEPLAARLLQGRSRGIVSKLSKVFGDRLAALAEVRGRGDRYDTGTYEELMADPSINPETKQIIVGDMEKNVRSFRDTAESTVRLSDSKIQDYQQKIIRLTEDLDVQKARREILVQAARRIVSDYQNRYLNRIRQGGQAGEVSVTSEVMRTLQQLKQSPDIIGRIIDQIATTVPDDVLNQQGITAPQLLDALIQNNGGNLETLSAAMGESQRGVGREMLQTAIGIMQASDQLAENVLAIRPTLNPEDVRALESLAVELRDAARTGARADMRQLVREVGGTAETLSKTRSSIGRLQPRIRRSARQLDEWMSTQEILNQALNDPALKELERKVYAHFDVRSVVVTQGGDHEFTIRNALTNEEVKILPGLDKLNVESNYAKLQKLFDDAAVYLSNPQDPNYDPRLAAAWRYMIDNTQQFWLNPSVNVFVPHMTPYQFDLAAFLSDPFKILRSTAGLESNASQVNLNAMGKVKKLLMEWERKTGTTVDIINKKAARASNMTLEDWYQRVFDEIAFRHQYLGQIVPKVGDILLSGHKVTADDLTAIRNNFNYLKHVREIAENSPGFTAAAINPARVIQGGISRRAEPTGPMTLPSRRASRALGWGAEWRRIQDWQQRMVWLNDPERFNRIVVGHMDTYNTPGYTVNSRWSDLYKGIVSDIRRETGPETIQEISELLYESQNLDELGENALTREQIQEGIVTEINQAFDNFEAEGKDVQRQKPDPIVDALTAENSFTKPRSEKVSAPFTFYDYGVRDYPGRLRMANDAYAWYSLDFVKSLERLQSALKRRITALTEGLSPKETTAVHKLTRQAQLRGDEFFDLAELKLNAKRIEKLLTQQTRVLQSSHKGRSSLESVFYRAQSAVGAYILMSPGARSNHTFGMMGVSGVFNALVENRVVRPSAKAWARLVSAAVKDVLKIPVSIPGLKITNEQLRSWSGVAQPYAEMVIKRREQMERLKELGVIPESDVRGAFNSMVEDWKNVFRRSTSEKLSSRIIKGVEGASDVHNSLWMAWAPQRYNDWLLNSHIREMRKDFTSRLQENALKHIRNRSDVLGTGYSDFSRPENILSAQEITGRKGPGAEREAFEKRRLFKVLGLDLDQIMLRYFRAVDEAQARGEETNQVSFLTPAEENSLDFEFAEGLGLSTPGTRNLAAQGSLLRRATGYIHGLPLWTMGKFMGIFNRLSNQPGAKYAQAVIPMVLMAGAYTTLMGLMRIQTTTALNRIFYKQSSALPTIGQAKTPDDWWRLLLRAQAGWWPIIGDVLMGAVLRTPDRFGHLDSMFVMWNFMQDVVNMGGDMWHTKDVSGPLTKFGERWLPPVKFFTRRAKSQTGIREHYNAVADIQASLPSSMETAAAKFRGGLRPTETTPMTYRALNAMYNGDWDEFDNVAKQYAAKKAEQGVKDGLLAFKHSISAHNPWIERLGKLPTEDERQQIMSRMDATQRKEVEKAENTFQQFGQRYGTRVAFTQQQAEAQRGATGGTGDPTAGIGNVKVPGILGGGGGGIVPHGTLPAGLRRISIGGRARSPFIGVGSRRATLPRRVSLGAPRSARRLVSGRLKPTRRVARRGRRGISRRRISMKV